MTIADRITASLALYGPQSVRELRDGLGIVSTALRGALRRLIADGSVVRTSEGYALAV